MSRTSRVTRGSDGFSLAEVLVALVIAALMAVVLTRYAAGSRMNAGRIAEQLEMTRLSDSLFARIDTGAPLAPGVTGGRAGDLSWTITVAPASFSAAMLTRGSDGSDEGAQEGQDQDTNFASLMEETRREEPRTADVPAAARRDWALYLVEVVVETASGRRIASNAIRSRPAATQ